MKKPFLGVAYYPEDWDREQIDNDLDLMVKYGISCIRIAEFAWRKMEPKPGEFHFEWLHEVVNKAKERGIGVVIGTPTATPPIWAGIEYPEAYVVDENGDSKKHGGRRNYCSNNENYRKLSSIITKKLAKEFGQDDGVIGWQIDNELEVQSCHCRTCFDKFHSYLESKYKTIENLNQKWNLNLFSQEYDSFDQIPFPDHSWHNPHLKLEYRCFDADSQIDFCNFQYEILKPLVKAPIGTDSKPYQRLDYSKLEEHLDVVQINHYHTEATLPQMGLFYDLIRPIKEVPYWNTETATSVNGATTVDCILQPYGYCRMNSWMSIALGGEATMYWLWRTHWAGHEQMHSAVLYPNGRPNHTIGEVTQTAKEFELASDFICNTKVEHSEIAIHYTSLAYNLFDTQGVLKDMNYTQNVYNHCYGPLTKCGVRPDVIMEGSNLNQYKMLVSPFTLAFENENEKQNIKDWVENGGVWVVGPMTDMRSSWGSRFKDRAYSFLEELLGENQVFEIGDYNSTFKFKWKDGEDLDCKLWYELFSSDNGLATVTDGYPSTIGLSPVLCKKVGKGTIYFVGSFLSEKDLQKVYKMAFQDAHITPYDITGELLLVPRIGENESGLIVGELRNQGGSITLKKKMLDILTNKENEGTIKVRPYELFIFKDVK